MEDNSELVTFLNSHKTKINPKQVLEKVSEKLSEKVSEKLSEKLSEKVQPSTSSYFPMCTIYFAIVLLIIGLLMFGLSYYYGKNEKEINRDKDKDSE